jgi:uncharacterized repeat protein (TIGR03803 family)
VKALLSSNTIRIVVAVAALGAFLTGCGGSTSSLQPPLASSNARPIAATTSEQVVHSFTGGIDGSDPATDLTLGADGSFYGTTVVGGYYNCGTIFKMTPRSSPPWQETVLYSFTCYGDGKNPYGGVAFDGNANLFGTTVAGGTGPICAGDGCGVAWELNASGESVLHSFTGGDDGYGPGGGLTMDVKGNFYGTTPDGGSHYSGVVYELSQHKGSGHERVIHAFDGGSEGGVGSLGRLLLLRGNLYGVTEVGGAHSAGTAYRLKRAGKNWRLDTLYAFKGSPDCGSPYGGLIADRHGNLYGTTYYGGANGLGCVFELIAAKNYAERMLYSFKSGSDGSSPTTTLLLAGAHTLYGTTSMGGGSCDCGTVFKLNIKTGSESVLHSFTGGQDGSYPYYGLTPDGKGHLLGTTATGGTSNQGVAFEITP